MRYGGKSKGENIRIAANPAITVRDFGPIAEAQVDLRPLTVFVGPGNTGKSCLATLFHTLHRVARKGTGTLGDPPRIPFGSREEAGPIPARIRERLTDWVSEEGDTAPEIPAEVMEHLRSILARPGGIGHRAEEDLMRCFGTETVRDLIRAGQKEARVDLHLPGTIGDDWTRYRFDLDHAESRLSCGLSLSLLLSLPLVEQLRIRLMRLDRLETLSDLPDTGDEDGLEGTDRFLALPIAEGILDGLAESVPNSHFLPDDRNSILRCHDVMTGGQGRSAPLPRLSGVRADFLEGIAAMGRLSLDGDRMTVAADRLEERILRGAVAVGTDSAGHPGFVYRPRNGNPELPVPRASSMVAALAPVALYLRYLVEPGDLLVIEEPEAHLHPVEQAALARELARMASSGTRILVTTHSEWILEQLGNIVRLSGLPEEWRAGLTGVDCTLGPEQIGVWRFRTSENQSGSRVTEIELDEEVGLFPTGFEMLSESLYNDSAEIFSRLQACSTNDSAERIP